MSLHRCLSIKYFNLTRPCLDCRATHIYRRKKESGIKFPTSGVALSLPFNRLEKCSLPKFTFYGHQILNPLFESYKSLSLLLRASVICAIPLKCFRALPMSANFSSFSHSRFPVSFFIYLSLSHFPIHRISPTPDWCSISTYLKYATWILGAYGR